jgi:glutamate-1-semialdehyde 2,1-aminomutase
VTPARSDALQENKVVAIVQARLGSLRMPAKVLSPVLGRPLLGHLIYRLRRASRVDEIVLAIPDSAENDRLAAFGDDLGIRVVRGSELDVLDRFQAAAVASGAAVVVRITGDCPMVDPSLVDRLVGQCADGGYGYVCTGETFPDGFDVEVCTASALRVAWSEANDPYDREHVTPFVRRDARHRSLTVDHSPDLSHVRLTLDEPIDLQVIKAVFEFFGRDDFTLDDVAGLVVQRPDLFSANSSLRRNEGATLGTGQKLWKRARNLIPGGSMLLSKKAEMHLPEGWPAYFSRASGCRVWDLDGVEYVDAGLMGIGTNILGYGYPTVDEAVRKVIDAGNMSTLNCPEEVYLAEKLIELHPWAEMARFTRSGGEACAVAVRIARAASGREGVAFCGYHGWHDWYLAANLGASSALDGHLLPGLAPAGVPRGLRGSALPFVYNDLPTLDRLLTESAIGVIFMEVQRGAEPLPGFLEGVRRLAEQHDAVLVFDECTSGFRRTLGGLHLHYGVEPDIAVFGKTLGNGYAINAIIGRRSVMEAAEETFISSTFWTERIGPTAALASLAAMADEDAPARVHQIGLDVRHRWTELANRVGLPMDTTGIPALGGFVVNGFDPVLLKTFITQEMLAARFLAGTALYASIAHDPAVLDAFSESLEPVFKRVADLGTPADLLTLLPRGPAQSGFKRLV